MKPLVVWYEFCHQDPNIENCFYSAGRYHFSIVFSSKHIESRGNNFPTKMQLSEAQEEVSPEVTSTAPQTLVKLHLSYIVFLLSLGRYY